MKQSLNGRIGYLKTLRKETIIWKKFRSTCQVDTHKLSQLYKYTKQYLHVLVVKVHEADLSSLFSNSCKVKIATLTSNFYFHLKDPVI